MHLLQTQQRADAKELLGEGCPNVALVRAALVITVCVGVIFKLLVRRVPLHQVLILLLLLLALLHLLALAIFGHSITAEERGCVCV